LREEGEWGDIFERGLGADKRADEREIMDTHERGVEG
jgi:hypothetical protein